MSNRKTGTKVHSAITGYKVLSAGSEKRLTCLPLRRPLGKSEAAGVRVQRQRGARVPGHVLPGPGTQEQRLNSVASGAPAKLAPRRQSLQKLNQA